MNEKVNMKYQNQLKYDQMIAYIAKSEHCKTDEDWDVLVDNMRELITPRGTMNRELILSTVFGEWSREHFNKILASTQRHFAPKEKTQ